eukprot:m.236630 g.236630  ORF g.236630 m.236630 type:complete len:450 (+) comp20684_c0_seq1:19-1368(+)
MDTPLSFDGSIHGGEGPSRGSPIPEIPPPTMAPTDQKVDYVKNARFDDKFLHEIPKVDLHLHLDGSLRVGTIIDLAKKYNVHLPAYTEEGLRELVYKDSFQNLEEYLEGFKYTTAVMQTAEALERVSYELACDNFEENVIYFEVRFAPQLHASSKLDIEQVLLNVNAGLARAKHEYNQRPNVRSGEHPPYEYAMIVCAMRFFTPESSDYYRSFCEVHKFEDKTRLYGLASMALVTAAEAARQTHKLPIVALDIAGAESGFPASQHTDAYRYAHKRFLNKTVHAGEGFGPESIFQAITDLHAERIGHGFHLFNTDHLRSKLGDPETYVESLVQYLAEHRITLEVCLSSNLQTMPQLQNDLRLHVFKKMLDARLSVCLCTDNRLMSNTTVTREYRLAADAFQLTAKQLRDMTIGGFKRSFFPQSYGVKRAYVRRVITYYEQKEREYGLRED